MSKVKTNIFVSSTCYDLSQIRKDLSDFIIEIGHSPMLSEFNNFPISPELDTVENCIKNVHDLADILILIVGNRYGTIIENGKSITNTEFLTARRKGIPIFCFIDKKTLNALGFWSKNKDGDFSDFVDNIQIFEFIEHLRDNTKIWTFPFETAQDIVETLRSQLSFLFKSSLEAREFLTRENKDGFENKLSPRAMKILYEKEDIFEYLFLSQVLVDEIKKKEFFKNDFEYELTTEPNYFYSDFEEVFDWANRRLSAVSSIIKNFNILINNALPRFLGDLGQPSDFKGLFYVSSRYANLYENILKWIIETRSIYIENEDMEELKMVIADLAKKPVEDIWNFPFHLQKEIEKANNKLKLGEKNIEVKVSLELKIDSNSQNKFEELMEKLRKKLLP